jgi:hypothetical protein
MDPVGAARSHDFPSSIDMRSTAFNYLEASLESGSVIDPLEPVVCTLLGMDFPSCVSENEESRVERWLGTNLAPGSNIDHCTVAGKTDCHFHQVSAKF